MYKSVIEEVIKNVRNDFVNMGVDEQVLYDLQMLWEQKLLDYKVISPSEYFGNIPNGGGNGNLMMNTTMMGPSGAVHHMSHPHSHIHAQQQFHQAHIHHQQQQHMSHGNDGGLNVLANGAVAAASVAPTDNYGYIVRHEPLIPLIYCVVFVET